MKLALVALMALAADARADCDVSGLVARVLTPTNTIVPGDGGIVVAAMVDERGKLDPGDAASAPTGACASAAT